MDDLKAFRQLGSKYGGGPSGPRSAQGPVGQVLTPSHRRSLLARRLQDARPPRVLHDPRCRGDHRPARPGCVGLLWRAACVLASMS